MTIDFYGKAKSKRKRGKPQGKFAAWFTNRASFAFTSLLSFEECAERLNENRFTASFNAADIPLRIFLRKTICNVSIAHNGDDRSGFSIIETVKGTRARPSIRSSIEGHVHKMDGTVVVDGRISCTGAERWMVVPLLELFFLLIILFPTNLISYFVWSIMIFFLIVFGLIKAHHVKTTRLALIRDMLEAKQKSSREEQTEPTDGNSPGSTELSASL